MRRVLIVLVALGVCAWGACGPGALAPEAARDAFVVDAGLVVELVAAEPVIEDPVAMAFDEHGRLYVVENRGYPEGDPSGPQGRIALLTDTDRDGEYERRSTFVSGLSFPNGVMPWKGGIIVTDAPHVLYFRDGDGDGAAEIREVLLEGFSEGGSTQLRVSHPTLGIDNWIYLTNGLSGGSVRSPMHADSAPLEMGPYDLRFNPLSGEMQLISGRAQFGLTMDWAGNRFVCSNRNHLVHAVLPRETLTSNPYYAPVSLAYDIPDHGAAAAIYALSEARTTAHAHAGTFTAACGLHVYEGDALPENFRGNVFVCEPTANLIHRDVLEPDGPAFVAKRAYADREFLATTDSWSRPVYITTGPDGALYFCDMYRKSIEHPAYLPKEVAAATDFDSGKGMGRIYRVRAKGASRATPPEFEDPVARLRSENGWTRRTAQRLLLVGIEGNSDEALLTLLNGDGPVPGRLQALHLLDAHARLDEEILIGLVKDAEWALRVHALRLLPRYTEDGETPVDFATQLCGDPDARVRFEAALLLGQFGGLDSGTELAALLATNPGDPWLRDAVLSGLSGKAATFLSALLALPAPRDGALLAAVEQAGRNLFAESALEDCDAALAEAIGRFVDGEPDPRAAMSLLIGMADGLRRNTSERAAPPLLDVVRGLEGATGGTLIAGLQQEAEAVIRSTEAAPDDQILAVRFLGLDTIDAHRGVWQFALSPRAIPAIQQAAVRELTRYAPAQSGPLFLEAQAWRGLDPGLRPSALQHLLREEALTAQFLEGVESGAIPRETIDASCKRLLGEIAFENLRARAQEISGAGLIRDRSVLYEAYKDVLTLTADGPAGREIFKNNCSMCHQFAGEGHLVGPELTDIRSQPPEAILMHIIDPNRALYDGYEYVMVDTVDLEHFAGILQEETPAYLVLRGPMGVESRVERANIEQITATGTSMMPEALEESMSKQELCNLIAYLRGE
ncbi:MAG: c-type cytochrome [Candidatus Hydrogenedentes bacterium]|nr:c-type cytochrome [Candidatus Hydrogenedentota bacterium]